MYIRLVVHWWGGWSSVYRLSIDWLAVGLAWLVGQHDGLVSAGVSHGGLLGQLLFSSSLPLAVDDKRNEQNHSDNATNNNTCNAATGGAVVVVVVIIVIALGVISGVVRTTVVLGASTRVIAAFSRTCGVVAVAVVTHLPDKLILSILLWNS